MQGTLPRPDVAPRLQAGYVGLAADADNPEPAVLQLALLLEDAMMLPFVMFADADGGSLGGYAGVGTHPTLLEHLDRIDREAASKDA